MEGGVKKNATTEETTVQHLRGRGRKTAASSRHQEKAVIALKEQTAERRAVRVEDEDIPITTHDHTHLTCLGPELEEYELSITDVSFAGPKEPR